MAIPVSYNLLSAKERWTSSVVAVLGIAGTVGVFVAMLALARGFKATLTSSGQPQNAIVQRSGSDNEMTSAITLEEVRIVGRFPDPRLDALATDLARGRRERRLDSEATPTDNPEGEPTP